MKNKKFIFLIVLVLIAFLVSTCADPGAKQSEDQSVSQDASQGDEKSNIPKITYSKEYVWYMIKIVKAASNLSWAAAAKIAIVAHLYPYDHYISSRVWQGDLSDWRYGKRNAKGSNYQNFNYDIEQAAWHWGVTNTTKKMGVASTFHINWDLSEGHPVIITRRDKNNTNSFWAVVIYAIDDNNQISVWDPEHGWDYTCDYEGFANDSRYDQLSLLFHNAN